MRRVQPTAGALGVVFLLGAGGTGCEREMAPAICPAAVAGGLVITEVRGAQSGAGADNQGQWIEVYNASSGALELEGLQVVMRKVDGSDEGVVIVREPVAIAAGGYAVLGRFAATDERPAHVDYAWGTDFASTEGEPRSLFDAAAFDAEACDERVDRIVFDDLPSSGTYSLGTTPPDASSNDPKTAWCTDTTDDADAQTLGLPGTPGKANHPCP